MPIEAEVGVTPPQAQGRLEPQELEEAGRRLLSSLRGSVALRHLDSEFLASRTVRESVSVVSSHPVCGHL